MSARGFLRSKSLLATERTKYVGPLPPVRRGAAEYFDAPLMRLVDRYGFAAVARLIARGITQSSTCWSSTASSPTTAWRSASSSSAPTSPRWKSK